MSLDIGGSNWVAIGFFFAEILWLIAETHYLIILIKKSKQILPKKLIPQLLKITEHL